MPYVNGKMLTPEDAIAKGLCPETGVSLDGVNIEDHIGHLWGQIQRHDPPGKDAAARIKMLRAFAKDHPEVHPKYDDDKQLIVEAD